MSLAKCEFNRQIYYKLNTSPMPPKQELLGAFLSKSIVSDVEYVHKILYYEKVYIISDLPPVNKRCR